jgi:hypothetical protein
MSPQHFPFTDFKTGLAHLPSPQKTVVDKVRDENSQLSQELKPCSAQGRPAGVQVPGREGPVEVGLPKAEAETNLVTAGFVHRGVYGFYTLVSR